MVGDHLGKTKVTTQPHNHDFEQMVFSWSLEDILNEDLYKHQVENIPFTFQCVEHYLGSFVSPLLEETRAELASAMEIMYRAPYAEIFSLNETKKDGKFMYHVTIGNWRNKTSEHGKEPYRTSPGDLLILVDGIPESVSDLQHDIDSTPVGFNVKASNKLNSKRGCLLFFLTNVTTNKRIWNSLHMHRNMNIIEKILHSDFSSRYGDRLELGKTTTVSVLLFILLKMNRRTLTCAPTNVAIDQVASRLLNLVKGSFNTITAGGDFIYCIGDILLFGNKKRLKVGTETEEIYLEGRINRLTECLGSFSGWKHCIRSMTDLLKNCVSQYHVFKENELIKEKQFAAENQIKTKATKLEVNSFIEFVRDRFSVCVSPLRRCIITLLTHIPKSFLREDNFQRWTWSSKCFEQNCNNGLLFQNASLIFCTSSTSYKLHTVKMKPLEILVIDEAAQLKEAESTIPLQLPGMKHAILIGDEYQLPAMVSSNVCIESGFGRSLFARLSSLGHSMHLLNVQYRMHPSISFFPNCKFYQNRILDAENVMRKSYEKQYLSGPMFGPYSFINCCWWKRRKGR
ncbi:putative P-loop containing nucleoside triphosphate hydrolase, DNA2/NAM7 helicase, helicase [Helianthus annuus]|nr:putative P-loop containing nucleoside triphosphate hydrolase, DNA2/NAM7 helicase, helicase [Helianthus annuus]